MRYLLRLMMLISLSCVLCGVFTLNAANTKNGTEQNEPSTTIEKIVSSKGELIIRDFYEIGEFQKEGVGWYKILLQGIVVYTPGSEERYFALKLFLTKADSDGEAAFLDYDELIASINAIDYMLKNAEEMSKNVYEDKELQFTTRGDLEVGMYQSGKRQGAFITMSKWSRLGTLYLNLAEFAKFKDTLSMAALRLQTLGAKTNEQKIIKEPGVKKDTSKINIVGKLYTKIYFVLIFLGLIPALIANSKGKSFIIWWLYGVVLFIIALPHSILTKTNWANVEKAQIKAGMIKCPYCAEMIKTESIKCRYCGSEVLAKGGGHNVT
ncbi:MAG: zinc ribbon domain-containing protein [Dehalococcoidales bacterium]|nr:zinc ribbon domain-containing protein [Dehalococcoidales bacterium]